MAKVAKRKKPLIHPPRIPLCDLHSPAFRQQFEQAAKLLETGSMLKSEPLCEALFRKKPDDPDVLKMMGYLRYGQHRFSDAIPLLERANEIRPRDVQIRRQLIASYKDASQFEKALTMAHEFLDDPLSGEESVLAFQIFCGACDWSSAEILRDKVVRKVIAGKGDIPISGDFLLALHGMGGVSPEDMLALHQIAAAHGAVSLPAGFTPDQTSPCGRLKVAYLSPDFYSHPVSYFAYPVIAAHNRQQIEVWCYAHFNKQDGITAKISSAADHFIDITEMPMPDVARRIRADGIHVLVDLAGYTYHSRLRALAWRPAPVQISWLGYPNTSGMPEVDFHITDHDAECENGTRYTETLLYMPESFICFGMRPTCPHSEIIPAKKNGYVTFGSFSSIRKINPRVIHAWCRILSRVPGSHMALKARWDSDIVRGRVLAEFARHGISSERITLLPVTMTYDEHVGQYNLIDIALDTFPYTGTTTTCEALFMGVPVITLVGDEHAHRVSYSILKNAGFTETIAHSVDEYVDKAVNLGMNPVGLSLLRKTLPSLFKYSVAARPDRFVPQLETLYMDACRQKGLNLSGIAASVLAEVSEEDSPDDKKSTAAQGVNEKKPPNKMSPSGSNPFDGLPGEKASRGLMVVERLTDTVKNMVHDYLASPAAAECMVVMLPFSMEQEIIAAYLDSISAATARQFSLIRLKDAPVDAEILSSLVTACGQYHTLKGVHGPWEKKVRNIVMEHGLPVIEYETGRRREAAIKCQKMVPDDHPQDTQNIMPLARALPNQHEFLIPDVMKPLIFLATFLRQRLAVPNIAIAEIGARIINNKNTSEPAEVFHMLPEARVIAFEPNRDACNKVNLLNDQILANIHAYPYAVSGTCGKQTLYETRVGMYSSLYKPNEELLRRFMYMDVSYLKGTREIDAITLDAFMAQEDVDEIDFIKIDIQGAELDVFKAAKKALPQLIGVCTEVEWAQLYENQPLFGDVDALLRQYGLQMHHLIASGGQPIKGSAFQGHQQTLWSDAVYFPSLEVIDTLPKEKLLKLAIMTSMYDVHDLAQYALKRYDKLTGSALLPDYVEEFMGRFANKKHMAQQHVCQTKTARQQNTRRKLADPASRSAQVSTSRKLHIGGREPHPDWEIMDALSGEHVDHVGNAVDLSRFGDNTFAALYTSHVLEHFSYQRELGQALQEWKRVLAPGGVLYASVPDIQILSRLFLNKELSAQDHFMVMRMMFGGQTTNYDFHRVGYDEDILRSFLTEAGFVDICRVDDFGLFHDTSTMVFRDTSISLNIMAKKL